MIDRQEKEALTWLSNEIENMPNIVFRREIKENKDGKEPELLTKKLEIPPLAELVLFKYEASVGNLSGYWDKFPIVLVVRLFEDHFFGFNLHYFDKKERSKIIGALLRLHGKVLNKKEMYRVIYPFLDSLVKVGIYNSAYKNYSYRNMKSEFVTINVSHYKLVSNLPLAKMKENK